MASERAAVCPDCGRERGNPLMAVEAGRCYRVSRATAWAVEDCYRTQVAALRADLGESEGARDRMRGILDRVAEAVRGPSPAGGLPDWGRLPETGGRSGPPRRGW